MATECVYTVWAVCFDTICLNMDSVCSPLRVIHPTIAAVPELLRKLSNSYSKLEVKGPGVSPHNFTSLSFHLPPLSPPSPFTSLPFHPFVLLSLSFLSFSFIPTFPSSLILSSFPPPSSLPLFPPPFFPFSLHPPFYSFSLFPPFPPVPLLPPFPHSPPLSSLFRPHVGMDLLPGGVRVYSEADQQWCCPDEWRHSPVYWPAHPRQERSKKGLSSMTVCTLLLLLMCLV